MAAELRGPKPFKQKVVKLTDKKIKYITRAKTDNIRTKRIALEMKVSESTVKRSGVIG